MLRISVPSVSLAAKCRLLFGAAVLLIVAAALMVPWLRMTDLVHEKNIQIARQMALLAVERSDLVAGDWTTQQNALREWWARDAASYGLPGKPPQLIPVDPLKGETPRTIDDAYLRESIQLLAQRPGLHESPPQVRRVSKRQYVYRYVLPVRSTGERMSAGTLLGVVVAEYSAPYAYVDILENLSLISMAGALAGILAVLVFYIITQKLILSPVRELRAVADAVAAGNHEVRSGIETADEFEDLARAFNAMLSHLEQQQEELRTINRSLDTRLGELAERNVALFEANKIKSQFIASVSHELRTPLTSIIGFAELLREGTAEPSRVQRYVENILHSGRMLLGIINDLLDLAKIEAGKLTLHRGPIDLKEMSANLLDFMQPLAVKNELTLAGEIADDVPVITSDSGRIQQVLYNLLSNAIKFTPAGGGVTLRIAPASHDRVMLSILDTGIGIPMDQLPHIFDKFRQIDSSLTREHGGTGLGLAITKELVQVLGGSISVSSEPGKGSEFRVLLPLTAPEIVDMPMPALT